MSGEVQFSCSVSRKYNFTLVYRENSKKDERSVPGSLAETTGEPETAWEIWRVELRLCSVRGGEEGQGRHTGGGQDQQP